MAEDTVEEKFGNYKIVGRLGKGGMATIYRAQTPKGETVALKVISGEFVQKQEFVKRFSREAQVYAALKHPSIVNIRDSGNVGDRYFVVMDLIPGKTMDALLTPGKPQDPAWACDVMATVLDALQLAHSKGIVHRDMKPSNIIITPDGRPVILDFGIAHVTNSTAITQEGAFLGTPAYVAPEMVHGGTATSPAFDLYSVGIMLYEMVAGRLPFESDSPMGTLFKHMQERPTPPRTFNPNLSRRIQTAIMRALEKEPARRAKSAAAMAAELRAAKDDSGPEVAGPDVSGAEPSEGVQRSDHQTIVSSLDLRVSDLPPHLQRAMQVAIGLFQEGKKEKAQAYLQSQPGANSDDETGAEVQYCRAILAWQGRDHAAALDLFTELCLRWPDSRRVWTSRLMVARCFQETKELYAAVKDFKGILDQCPEADVVRDARSGLETATYLYVQSGETLLTAGDEAGARQVFTRLKELWINDKGNPLYRSMWVGISDENLAKCDSIQKVNTRIDAEKAEAGQALVRRRRLAGFALSAVLLFPAISLGVFRQDLYYEGRFRYHEAKADVPAQIEDLKLLLAHRSQDYGSWARLAHLLAQQKRVQEALDAYEKALAMAQPPEALVLEAASCAAAAGAHTTGIRFLDAYVAKEPGAVPATLKLAELQTAARMPKLAREKLQVLVQKVPTNTAAWKALAAAQRELGDAAGALASLERAAGIDTKDLQIQQYLAETYFKKGDLAKASAAVKKLTTGTKASAAVLRLQAGILGKSGDLRGAATALEGIGQLPEGTVADWMAAAQAWEAARDPQRAITDLQQALNMKPNDPGVLTKLAHLCASAGLAPEAANYYQALIAIPKSRTVENLWHCARSMIEAHQLEAVAPLLNELRPKYGATPEFSVLEGDLAVAQDNLPHAMEIYETALSAPKPPAGLARKVGHLLMERSSHTQAGDYLLRALEQDPNDVRSWEDLGQCYLKLQKPNEAVNAFQKWAELDPKDPNAHLNLGVALNAAGQPEQAVMQFQESLRLNPNQDEAPKIRSFIAKIQHRQK